MSIILFTPVAMGPRGNLRHIHSKQMFHSTKSSLNCQHGIYSRVWKEGRKEGKEAGREAGRKEGEREKREEKKGERVLRREQDRSPHPSPLCSPLSFLHLLLGRLQDCAMHPRDWALADLMQIAFQHTNLFPSPLCESSSPRPRPYLLPGS